MMNRRKMALLGAFILFLSFWATGALERLITGDTRWYLRTLGGYAGTAVGLLLLEHAIIRKKGG